MKDEWASETCFGSIRTCLCENGLANVNWNVGNSYINLGHRCFN